MKVYKDKEFKALAKLYSKTALQVCEGQQYDIDFEAQSNVTIDEYLKMIEYKTAVLVAASLKMGAIIANAPQTDTQHIYDFGLNLGVAFQLQDDYLDVYGTEDFGKLKAGDIIENKKTWMYLKVLELANDEDKLKLKELYTDLNFVNEAKINKVIAIFDRYSIQSLINKKIEYFTMNAQYALEASSLPNTFLSNFKKLSENLMSREV